MIALCGCRRERVLFTLAGTFTLLSAVLAVLVSPWFLLVAAVVGLNELVFAAAGECPASLLLRRVCRVQEGGR